MSVELKSTPERLRQIHHSLFSTKNQLSTKEAEAFLLFYGDQLTTSLNDHVREFIKEKLA
ncbi:MAG TPA: hypothetical protein VJ731_12980 [Terriglobales bacterium]|nr:hypothetical protein [Terriglobales bacterium]